MLGVIVVLCVLPLAVRAESVLNRCTEITAPGDYVLTHDIFTPPHFDGGCIAIHSTSDVTLDCQGHFIVSPGRTLKQPGSLALTIDHVQRFAVRNCRLEGKRQIAEINDSSNGTLENNQVSQDDRSGYRYFYTDHTDHLTVHNNIFNAMWGQMHASYTVIDGNTFNCPARPTSLCMGLVLSVYGGNHNTYSHNVLEGKSVAGQKKGGTDDGMLLEDESNATVTDNDFRNNGDAGVESLGMLKDSVIARNRVSGVCSNGFGGWFYASLLNNEFSDNTVTGCQRLFNYSRIFGLRPMLNGVPKDDAVYFANNRFLRNRIVDQATPERSSAMRMFVYASGMVLRDKDVADTHHDMYVGLEGHRADYQGRETAPTRFVLTNNLFQDNDFGSSPHPLEFGMEKPGAVFTPGLIVDGGGNRCAPNTAQPNADPLKCN